MSEILKNPIDLSEVQDFSMGKKGANPLGLMAGGSPFGGKGGKLDDMLSKLMKKNNCVSIIFLWE